MDGDVVAAPVTHRYVAISPGRALVIAVVDLYVVWTAGFVYPEAPQAAAWGLVNIQDVVRPCRRRHRLPGRAAIERLAQVPIAGLVGYMEYEAVAEVLQRVGAGASAWPVARLYPDALGDLRPPLGGAGCEGPQARPRGGGAGQAWSTRLLPPATRPRSRVSPTR